MRGTAAFLAIATAFAQPARAQRADVPTTPAKPWRCGVLVWHRTPNDLAALAGIRKALSTFGRRHDFLARDAEEDATVAKRHLAEFEREQVDLVFALGTRAALLARDAVKTRPVVFTAVTHPVGSGVVPSWRGSGTNIAGTSNWIAPETTLHVFRLAVPELTRLGVLRSRKSSIVSAAELRGMRDYLAGADAPNVEVFEQVIDDPDAISAAVHRLAEERVQAIWIPIDNTIYRHTPSVARAAQRRGIPIVSSSLQGARTGAVAGVLVDYEVLGARAGAMAVSILTGVRKPADMPIGTMRGYQVVVNLDAARASRYQPPLALLALADVILGHAATREGTHRDGK